MFFLLSGYQLPFVLLALCLLGSYVCASIIANDENQQTIYSSDFESDSNPNNNIIKTKSIPKQITAFINPSTRIFDNSKLNKQKIINGVLQSQLEMSILKEPPKIYNHYVCPPTSLEALRKRYGTNQDFWGDWSASQTRSFYKQMLPKALQIDGALGLSLEQRAEIASANRHALRLYSRERCHLPARVIAKLYDGLRHLHVFGTWKSDGMDWNEVKQKYALEAKKQGYVTEEEILLFVYEQIVERASVTNAMFDEISNSKKISSKDANQLLFSVMKSIFEAPKIQNSSKSFSNKKFSPKLPSQISNKINSVIPKLFSI